MILPYQDHSLCLRQRAWTWSHIDVQCDGTRATCIYPANTKHNLTHHSKLALSYRWLAAIWHHVLLMCLHLAVAWNKQKHHHAAQLTHISQSTQDINFFFQQSSVKFNHCTSVMKPAIIKRVIWPKNKETEQTSGHRGRVCDRQSLAVGPSTTGTKSKNSNSLCVPWVSVFVIVSVSVHGHVCVCLYADVKQVA